MADDLASALDEIRGRGYRKGTARGLRAGQLADHAADDIPRLLAAVEAALKAADSATVLLSACGVSGRCSCGTHPVAWNLDPAKLRAAITAELTGKEAGDGG